MAEFPPERFFFFLFFFMTIPPNCSFFFPCQFRSRGAQTCAIK